MDVRTGLTIKINREPPLIYLSGWVARTTQIVIYGPKPPGAIDRKEVERVGKESLFDRAGFPLP